MMLYLDDDSVFSVLVHLLRNAGHDVRLPVDLGSSGAADPIHLRYAIREQRSLLTHNYDDFRFLHELLQEGGGRHAGILVIRRENNAQRDMKPPHIVRAIGNLIASAFPIADEYIVLNHWR